EIRLSGCRAGSAAKTGGSAWRPAPTVARQSFADGSVVRQPAVRERATDRRKEVNHAQHKPTAARGFAIERQGRGFGATRPDRVAQTSRTPQFQCRPAAAEQAALPARTQTRQGRLLIPAQPWVRARSSRRL